MKYTPFHEQRFRLSVDQALSQVTKILENCRNPRLAGEDENHTHSYDDKYTLAEFVTNTSIAALRNALERLGLDGDKLRTVLGWVHKERKQVTLRLEASDACSLVKTEDVELRSKRAMDQETTTTDHGEATSKVKTETTKTTVVTTVKEYHWQVIVEYQILLFAGTNKEGRSIELQRRRASTIIITSAGGPRDPVLYDWCDPVVQSRTNLPPSPIDASTSHPPIDVDMTWLFRMISPQEDRPCQFAIDRQNKANSKTPRRNRDVDVAFDFHGRLSSWCCMIQEFFKTRLEGDILHQHNPVVVHETSSEINMDCSKEEAVPPTKKTRQALLLEISAAESVFCPVLPLMENASILSMGDIHKLLAEQERSLEESTNRLFVTFHPAEPSQVVSTGEATIVLLCLHMQQLATQYIDSMDYLEHMIKQQLIKAIGRQITAMDFESFMRFHALKLFQRDYSPKPFSYAIRRSDKYYPDGILSIVGNLQENDEPIETVVRHVSGEGNSGIFIPINAATSIEVSGDRYLHGWLQHGFEMEPLNQFHMVCRARQFSSFLMVIGTMAGADKFDPKHAMILQNKDEIRIPLEMSLLPTAKDFKDAVHSLSPEQRAFCQAFRGMQLESSVFGVCIIQLKPQLEMLLGLPGGALTKEIQLTQDLMSLFVDHQIPSDLLSFDEHGGEPLDAANANTEVKEHVRAVMDVIENAKQKQLADEEKKKEMREAQGRAVYAIKRHRVRPVHQASYASASTYEACGDDRTTSVSRRGRGDTFYSSLSVSRKCSGPAPTGPAATMDDWVSVPSPPDRGAISNQQAAVSSNLSSANDETNFGGDNPSPLPTKANEDFTLIPKLLDGKLTKYDTDNALGSVIIKAGCPWTQRRQENLLTPLGSACLSEGDLATERKKAFDLLDAISRSGSLPIRRAELHVFVAASHRFENNVMGTVVQDNVNPIEKAEKSALLVASAVHGLPPSELIQDDDHRLRLAKTFPQLFGEESST